MPPDFSRLPPVSLIVAMPDWREYADKLPELVRHPLPTLAPNALLVMARPPHLVEEATSVMRAWGFHPRAEIVWVKTRAGTAEGLVPEVDSMEVREGSPPGQPIVLSAHETVVLAVHGRWRPGDKHVRSVLVAAAGEEGSRPAGLYERIERLAGPEAVRLELFAKAPRPGWHVSGEGMDHVWTPALPAVHGRPLAQPEVEVAPGTLEARARSLELWAAARQRADEGLLEDEEEDLAELVLLPRHKIRRADGAIVPACCAECQLAQYASPAGVVCTRGHGGAPSIAGCESCGLTAHADGCRLNASAPAVNGTPAPVNVTPPAVNGSAPAKTAAAPPPEPARPAPNVPDAKRDVLLERARGEGLLKDEDLAEGPASAWVKLLYRASPGWFPPPKWFSDGQTPKMPPRLPGERLNDLAQALEEKGYFVTLNDVARLSVVQRDLARAWLSQPESDAPEFLSRFAKAPEHAPQCVDGCIGAEAGCPHAQHAWAKLMPEELELVGPENAGEIAGPKKTTTAAATTPATAAAPPATDGEKRGRGRPKGARNKPKVAGWAAAAKATAGSEDPEHEEQFFS
jgi:N6-adenosine-specific RNA methylase IME4